jgi:hypothetical protein
MATATAPIATISADAWANIAQCAIDRAEAAWKAACAAGINGYRPMLDLNRRELESYRVARDRCLTVWGQGVG